MASIRGFVVGPMGNNTYVIHDDEAKMAAVVDPSMESERVLDWVRLQGLTVLYIVNTHGHTDHTFNNAYFHRETGAQLKIHQADEPMLSKGPGRWTGAAEPSPAPDGYLTDGQELLIGSLTVQVLETPGHTPGSICLAGDGWVLTGDTLFAGSIGRFDFPGGSAEKIVTSIQQKLFSLPYETAVLPGHGAESTVARERATNPFVGLGAAPPSQWRV